ncbi:Aldehyde/histidinol dehydrogenase [Lasiosphaeris hirsuta]|uniref:aldehyde dehydrogenase (NAD(+)) n=1 Tax=Lasiosphaeris hirsuta TaxID=260670 RepID=A0AA40EA00_9PEZI|nr:Aldehyde/histidinol dehydrogenase [Lasiosphaeris hirsuta]
MASTTPGYTLDFDTFHNTINNVLTRTQTTRHTLDPSTEVPLPEVPVATQDDVDAAVRAGQAAFSAWRERPVDERAAHLERFADAIEANLADFAALLGREAGKPVQAANMELAFALGHLRATAKLRVPEVVVEESEERTASVRYVPLGVGVGIVPWNFPVLLGLGKLDAALLTGNTFIWKPSPFAPYSALKLGELGALVFPPGVLQVLSGDDGLGPQLTAHPGVAKVSFTGSSATGKKVMASCAATLKRVTLELGGNDAAIVCPDADLATVVPKLGALAFLHSGQICMDVKRLYVHASIYDAFLTQLVAFVKTLKMAGAGDPDAFTGPVQNSAQYARVRGLYADIAEQNWAVALGGLGGEGPHRQAKGYFLPPTIIDNPPDASRIVVEEPFGPIVPVLKWSDEADVVRRANDSMMGLGASVWSADVANAERLARRLEAGTVWVNSHFELAPHVPFGGHKWSGIGVDWGVEGMKGWCNPQAVWVRKL